MSHCIHRVSNRCIIRPIIIIYVILTLKITNASSNMADPAGICFFDKKNISRIESKTCTQRLDLFDLYSEVDFKQLKNCFNVQEIVLPAIPLEKMADLKRVFENMTQLRYVDFSFISICKPEDLPEGFLAKQTNLQVVDLQGCENITAKDNKTAWRTHLMAKNANTVFIFYNQTIAFPEKLIGRTDKNITMEESSAKKESSNGSSPKPRHLLPVEETHGAVDGCVKKQELQETKEQHNHELFFILILVFLSLLLLEGAFVHWKMMGSLMEISRLLRLQKQEL